MSPHTIPETGSAADLVVALDGFDGPIDLLLTLAREQKVDLSRISILALAEQYLVFISSARELRLEVAADYLVMAAWLAYLKSRLLLPEQPEDEPNPADMAEALKFQLQRLEAMRQAAQKLQEFPQLGVDVFMRGAPEDRTIEETPVYFLPLYDLLTALGAPQRRQKPEKLRIDTTRLYSIEESRNRLRKLLGIMPEWTVLHNFLPEHSGNTLEVRSACASTFAAVLEMVKEGELDLRQDGTFAPIYLRRLDTPHTESDKI
ncbi:MAG: ScpA family protein [Alphaproteobacteria bacterium]|nr:ScpA family protein [Alphaproteobacteria bacterium]